MLALLLDENISPLVAEQIRHNRPDIDVVALSEWEDSRYLSALDGVLLELAEPANKTLVTYDQRTVVPIHANWGMLSKEHAGVVFFDHNTIKSSDFGSIIRAIVALWDDSNTEDWRNRVEFIRVRL